mgnify:CR=1 FL=1
MEPDTIQQLNLEERAYNEWERTEKNRILAMSNPQKKQTAWNKLFPKMERSDEWMLSAVVF